MSDLMLDGNAAAGVLQEIFAAEMTTAVGVCDSCGAAGEVGAVHLYRGAGMTLRCPTCGAVLMKIVTSDTRAWVDLRGLRTVQVGA